MTRKKIIAVAAVGLLLSYAAICLIVHKTNLRRTSIVKADAIPFKFAHHASANGIPAFSPRLRQRSYLEFKSRYDLRRAAPHRGALRSAGL